MEELQTLTNVETAKGDVSRLRHKEGEVDEILFYFYPLCYPYLLCMIFIWKSL